jgi:glutathione-regulated potassium-efflux system ancillary protein KefC/glutathione-regulated potassium-efflux system protein KefB
MSMLTEAAIFLVAAVIAVPLFITLRLGAVLGYLVAGLVIGPHGFALVSDTQDVLTFSKVGVVLLLFVIGLEIAPTQLWRLRGSIFSLGPLQLLACGGPVAAAAWWTGLAWPAVAVVGIAMAFSSTAIPTQTLEERGESKSPHGRAIFALIIFKYLALLPLLIAIPMMGTSGAALAPAALASDVAVKTLAVAGIVAAGHFVLRPVLRVLARLDDGESFTAMALLVVVGAAVLVDMADLPMAIGAFVAGVLLAECEYRNEVHARVEPFKGVLLGLFFIAVGMTADLSLILDRPGVVAGLVGALLALKLTGTYAVARLTGMRPDTAAKMAGFVPQAGELAFVVFATALAHDVLPQAVADLLIVVTTLSMAATPPIVVLVDRVLVPRVFVEAAGAGPAGPGEDGGQPAPVVVIGLGRFGQLVGRFLHTAGIRFTALDANPAQVEFLRGFGHNVSFGNAARAGVLKAAGVGRAQAVVLAVNNIDESIRIAESLRQFYPDVPVYALARSRTHAWRLMDEGVKHTVRATLGPSLELGRAVLLGCGMGPDNTARLVEHFRSQDEGYMLDQYALHRERGTSLPVDAEVERELIELFETPHPDPPDRGA